MAASVRPIRPQPLWVRVDENRVKLASFVALFLVGSALLLDAALIVLPGSLLSLVFAEDPDAWFRGLALVAGIAFVLILLLGAFVSAIQLANAEDWVRNRFGGRTAKPGEFPRLESAVEDMALAAGLATSPSLVVLDSSGINAYALGTKRSTVTLGVTHGFLDKLDQGEQRAVIAALVARMAAGDIMFGTALAALMGPLKAIRESGSDASGIAGGCADAGCSHPGCGDPGCTGTGCGDLDLDAEGCGGVVAIVLFLAFVALVTYVAVVASAWIVTLWGRALHRTAYEKADAEGMLLLKDPSPMLSALSKVCDSSNEVTIDDPSYDGIYYASTSGRPGIDARERRRFDRLREVVGLDGVSAEI